MRKARVWINGHVRHFYRPVFRAGKLTGTRAFFLHLDTIYRVEENLVPKKRHDQATAHFTLPWRTRSNSGTKIHNGNALQRYPRFVSQKQSNYTNIPLTEERRKIKSIHNLGIFLLLFYFSPARWNWNYHRFDNRARFVANVSIINGQVCKKRWPTRKKVRE